MKNTISERNRTPLDSRQAVERVAMLACEGLAGAFADRLTGKPNAFGRKLWHSAGSDLAYAIGLAATGLRVAAWLPADEADGLFSSLSEAYRRQLPLVVHLSMKPGQTLPLLPDQVPVLQSISTQEAADQGAIAHRIAELALSPVVHCLSDPGPESVELPSEVQLVSYLGDPDLPIEAPTPAQEMLFGRHRRRIPNWFNPDLPARSGEQRAPRDLVLQSAASDRFRAHHLPELIDRAYEEWSQLSGRTYAPWRSYASQDAQYLLICEGAQFASGQQAAEQVRQAENAKAGCLAPRVLQPLHKFDQALPAKSGKAVTFLETIAQTTGSDRRLEALLQNTLLAQTDWFRGFTGPEVTAEQLQAVFRNMLPKGDRKKTFYTGLAFAGSGAGLPKYEVLLQQLRRAYPDLAGLSLPEAETRTIETPVRPVEWPLAVRRYRDQGPPYSQLSGFNDRAALFYRHGRQAELVIEPFQSLPLTPAASAALVQSPDQRRQLPRFHAGDCTACGLCTTICPEMALPSLALNLEALLKGAMEISARRGQPASSLTPLVKNLATLANRAAERASAEDVKTLAERLLAAFDDLSKQMNLSEEKLEEGKKDLSVVLDVLQAFPAVRSGSFLAHGEWFSLAIDPQACTGCGQCVEICPENALELVPQSESLLREHQAAFHLWEELPDTSGDTINRLIQEERGDPFAALLLSRNFYQSLAGGAHPGSADAEKTLIHWVAAAAESQMQSHWAPFARELSKLCDDLSDNVHELLSASLPHGDFASLQKVLRQDRREKWSIPEIFGQVGGLEHLPQVDAAVLQRKLELLRALQDLQWLLREGPTGAGRARYSLLLPGADHLPWAASFPANPFLVPVWAAWKEGSTELAVGLLHGHIRQSLDHLRLLRRARLEVKNRYEPSIHDAQIASLSWEELDLEEQKLAPPLLLAGSRKQLFGPETSGLARLLDTDLPVKVIVLDHGYRPDDDFAQDGFALLSLIARQRNYLLRTTVADRRQLAEGLLTGLSTPRPALFHLFVPKEGGKKAWWEEAELARHSRVFPSLQFSPERVESGSLTEGLSLQSNPAPEADWSADESGYARTFADWAFLRPEWQDHFSAVAEKGALPLADYLQLPAKDRQGKQAAIRVLNYHGQEEEWAVSETVVRAAEALQKLWHTYGELGELRSTFTESDKRSFETALRADYDQRIATLEREFEARLRRQEQEQMEAVRQKLRDKLLSLATKAKTNRHEQANR